MLKKLMLLSIIASAGFSVADDSVRFGDVLETDRILTPEGVTNAILATALTVESDPVALPVATNALALASTALQSEVDPVAYPVATNALAVASTALQPDATNGMLRAEADTLATVTARGATTTEPVTFGSRGAGAVGVSSFASGANVAASGAYSHAEGIETTASDDASHAEGTGTTASGDASHAEGVNTTASGYASHAEGVYTAASEYASHAEGIHTTASGEGSHADGVYTTASGDASHASGFNSVASNITAFAWQGSDGEYGELEYGSHGPGTFNLNPAGGLAGLWIGETNMATTLSGYATTGAVAAVQAEVSNWVESIRGVHVDIATNIVYHVVVSNGHWLIREVQ